MSKPLVSVIIPTYNSKKTIKRAIKSVLRQNYENIELIVIDDASEDSTIKIVEKFSNIILIKNENNIGQYYSRFKGINKATGTYITFLDADDWLAPDAIYRAMMIARLYKADVVQMSILRRVSIFNIPLLYPSKYDVTKTLQANLFDEKLFPIACWGKLYHQDVFCDIEFPHLYSEWGEDRIFNLLVFDKARKIYFAPEAWYNYKWGGNGTKVTSDTIDDYTEIYSLKCQWAEINKFFRFIPLITDEYVSLLNYWTRQAINNRTMTKEEIISKLNSAIIENNLEMLNAEKIYRENKSSIKRYISLIINRIF